MKQNRGRKAWPVQARPGPRGRGPPLMAQIIPGAAGKEEAYMETNSQERRFEFNTLGAARSFVLRATKMSQSGSDLREHLRQLCIVLGDNERFWVVTPREARRLASQGYEVIE